MKAMIVRGYGDPAVFEPADIALSETDGKERHDRIRDGRTGLHQCA